MLELRTSHGNFSRFADLLRFLREENIPTVTVEAYYIFSKVTKITFTRDELQRKVNSGELV